MNTLKIYKKILLFLLLILFSNKAIASESLKKLDVSILLPNLAILNSKEKPFIFDFEKNTTSAGYVINFWATWCVPCKKELPDLSLLNLKLKKDNIEVLTISIDKKKIKEQLSFLFNNGASDLNHFFDKDMKIYKALKLRGIPTTILVNKKGLVVSKHEGILKWGETKIVNNIINLLN
ncbi:TlpA family protein disulfide reductase [Alphaproteobacteria bacterium]|nr:TlpA family protein disulfide reductase [Alphaproteobacteria bacterium]